MTMPIMRLYPPEPRVPGAQREAPYLLRGRDEEFTFLARSLDLESQPVYVVEGPPGSGKSSLIEAVGAYAAMRGFAVISLDANEVHAPFDLINEIANGILNRGHKSVTSKEKGIAAGFQIDLLGVRGTHGSSTQFAAVKSIGVHLQNIAQACGSDLQGFLLLIDNAASWRKHVPEDAIHHDPLCEICNVLNDGFRKRFKEPKLQTIFAGLPGTIDTITKLTSQRLVPQYTYRLQNVTNGAAYQIITDHLHLEPSIGPYRNDGYGIPEHTLHAITGECRGHIWHATATGHQLQDLLQKNPNPDHETIVDEALVARNTVYRTISNNIPQKDKPLFKALALAAQICDNRIPTNPIEDLLQSTAKKRGTPFNLDDWNHAGLMETLDTDLNYARHDHCRCSPGQPGYEESYVQIPAPSLATWYLDKFGYPDPELQQAVEKTFQRYPAVTPWTWRKPNITPIPELPPAKMVPSHPWTGNAAKIYLLQPHDSAPEPDILSAAREEASRKIS